MGLPSDLSKFYFDLMYGGLEEPSGSYNTNNDKKEDNSG